VVPKSSIIKSSESLLKLLIIPDNTFFLESTTIFSYLILVMLVLGVGVREGLIIGAMRHPRLLLDGGATKHSHTRLARYKCHEAQTHA
jgi:hypothetical protein